MSTAPLDSALGGSPTETPPTDTEILDWVEAQIREVRDGEMHLKSIQFERMETYGMTFREIIGMLMRFVPAVASSSQETPNG